MTSTPESSHGKTPNRKEKVDKTLFDTSFFSDEKIQYLIAEYGNDGPTWYLRIVFAILSEGGELHRKLATSFLKQLKATPEQAEAFFADCLEIGLLYASEDGRCLRSHRADREIEQLGAKREKWRKDKKLPGVPKESPKPPSDSTEVPDGISTDSVGNPKDSEEEEEGEDEREPELEDEPKQDPEQTPAEIPPAQQSAVPASPLVKAPVDPPKTRKPKAAPKYREFNPSDFDWPPAWGPHAVQAMADWVAYKAEAGHPSLLTSYRQQVTHFAGNPRRFAELSARSAREGWQGLNEHVASKGRTDPTSIAANGYSDAFNHNLELIRRAEAEDHEQG